MKEIALSLIKAAATIFPPLAALLGAALERVPAEHKSLADAVRATLPERTKTRDALDELDAGEGDSR